MVIVMIVIVDWQFNGALAAVLLLWRNELKMSEMKKMTQLFIYFPYTKKYQCSMHIIYHDIIH
jgi:hypothetical protein